MRHAYKLRPFDHCLTVGSRGTSLLWGAKARGRGYGVAHGGGGVALEARGQEGTDALCSVLRGHWGHKRCALACGPRWNGTSTRIRVGHGRLAPAATVRVRTLSRCGQRSSRRRDGAPPLPPRPWRWPMHGPMRGRGRARGARYAERARGLGTRTRLLLRIYLIRIMIVDKAVLTATCTDDRTKVCGHWGHLQLSLRGPVKIHDRPYHLVYEESGQHRGEASWPLADVARYS